MWIIEPPSSTIRRASAAYSSGVYGIAGHWSRFATAPEIEQLRMTATSKRLTICPLPRPSTQKSRYARQTRRGGSPGRQRGSYGHHPVLLEGAVDPLLRRHSQPPDDRRTGLARVDHVVDHVVPRGDVGIDLALHLIEHRRTHRL